jgi:O-antigen ligase
VKKVELAENLNTCLSGKSPLLCDHNRLTSQSSRQSGVMNADLFANLTVSMFFVVIAFLNQEPFKHKMFTLLSLLSGFFVILLSGTRGAWLTLLLLLVVYLFFLYKQNTKSSNSSKVFVALIIAIVLSIGSLNQNVSDRVHSAYTEVSNWLSDGKSRGPVSRRLVMYSRAIDNIEDVPFFGHGYRTSNLIIGMTQNHLHNGYLTNYYNGGICPT